MTSIGIATGCLHPLEALGDATHRIRALGADGIEFTFSTAAEVTAADPNMLADLADAFSFVTVHAPIRTTVESRADLTWVRHLEQIRAATGAEYIVFHPPKLPSVQFVTDDATVALENMQQRKGFDRGEFAAFLEGWDGPVVIDVCHAATWGMDEVAHLFDRYGDRIGHIHLSAYGHEEHEPVYQHPAFLDDIAHHLQDRRIVLESSVDSVEQLEAEYRFVTDYFEGNSVARSPG